MFEIPFHAEHLKLMEMREFEKTKVYPYLHVENLTQFDDLSYTLLHDGRIISCVGMVPMWEGVFEVWQIPSIYVSRYKFEYVKAFIRLMKWYTVKYKIRRLQTHSPADELHDRWMGFMGFECEGTLKEYGRFKDDYRIWRRMFIWE